MLQSNPAGMAREMLNSDFTNNSILNKYHLVLLVIVVVVLVSRHETWIQCMVNVGPASYAQTLYQH